MGPKRETPILRQEDFLYDLEWDENIDNYFIEVLDFESRAGNVKLGCANEVAVFTAHESILSKFQKFFSFKQITKKMRLLEKRYSTFKWMLSLHGVTYNPVTNVVTITDAMWKYIVHENSFAFAYCTYGEEKFDDLKSIFGDAPVEPPVAGDDNVIVLSSDDDEANDNVDPLLGPNNVVQPNVDAMIRENSHLQFIDVSSDTSKRVDFDVMNYLDELSGSNSSRGTEVSTTNSMDKESRHMKNNYMMNRGFSYVKKGEPSMEPNSSTGSNKPPISPNKP